MFLSAGVSVFSSGLPGPSETAGEALRFVWPLYVSSFQLTSLSNISVRADLMSADTALIMCLAFENVSLRQGSFKSALFVAIASYLVQQCP